MNIHGVSLKYDSAGFSVGFTPVTMTFSLDSTIETSPYILKSIDGLDPPPINIVIQNSLYSGSIYQTRNPQLRQLVMRIGFQPNYSIGQTVADLRSQLYQWLTPKFGLPVKIMLLDSVGSVQAYTHGHVSKCEANPFTKDPEIVLTFDCESSYFTTDAYVYPSPGTLPKTSFSIINPGDAPTGFMMQMTMTGTASSIFMSDRYKSQLWISYSFLSGDVITVNTKPGSRVMSLLRSSVVTNLLPYQNNQSTWLQMFGGTNYFTMNTANYNFTALTLYPNYWGV